MSRFYTYAYLRKDGTPYYIGKGTGKRAYKLRPNIHRPDRERILLLKKNLTEEEAFKHEEYMIYVLGRKDLGTGILLNLTNGGDGNTSGMIHTEETKRKIGASNKGKIHSKKQNKIHSEFMKGRKPWNKGLKGAGYRLGTKECVYRDKKFSSMTDAAEYFGVSISAVSKAQRSK